jgi:hypothetical protein
VARNYNYKPSRSHSRLEGEATSEVGQKYVPVYLWCLSVEYISLSCPEYA